jgi:hypothetical protein
MQYTNLSKILSLTLLAVSLAVWPACGSDQEEAPTEDGVATNNDEQGNDAVNNDAVNNDTANNDTANNGNANNDAANNGGQGAEPVGSCEYTNPFSQGTDCKLYTGAGWTVETATADCDAVFNVGGAFTQGGQCEYEAVLSQCTVEQSDDLGYTLASVGDDASQCDATVFGCDLLNGEHAFGNTCADGGDGGGGDNGGDISGVFIQPYEDCRAPLEGEPQGEGPDGQVCTQVAISGATEPGRRFEDYGSCEVVLSQRPYYSTSIPETPSEDPRLEDEAYMEELAWVTEQIKATACVCCHADSVSPSGASAWDIEAGALWIDTVPDSGLAMMAGLIDSASFGAYAPEENNGFDRDTTGVPTTDVARMSAFLTAEYERRGNPVDDVEFEPFGGPLYTQSLYEPEACENGEGVRADGSVSWRGSRARYVYILEADAQNPGVPPNLDTPQGTMWRLDVPPTEQGALSGEVFYGEAPEGLIQSFPEVGAPTALEEGGTYYIYTLLDIAIPLSRCLFTYPAPQ